MGGRFEHVLERAGGIPDLLLDRDHLDDVFAFDTLAIDEVVDGY
jgi:hypothetical protein